MKDEILDEIDFLINSMEENPNSEPKIKHRILHLIERLRILDIYHSEQSQYDKAVNFFEKNV